MRFDIVPKAKPRMTRQDRFANRKVVLEYFAYKDKLNYLAKKEKFHLTDQFSVIFYLPIPSSWSKKKQKEYVGKPHQSRPDIDNLVKGLLDALIDDDASVWNFAAAKIWAEKGGIEITNYA